MANTTKLALEASLKELLRMKHVVPDTINSKKTLSSTQF